MLSVTGINFAMIFEIKEQGTINQKTKLWQEPGTNGKEKTKNSRKENKKRKEGRKGKRMLKKARAWMT